MKVTVEVSDEVLRTLHDYIMDDILAALDLERADAIMRMIKPNDEFGRGVYWAVKQMKKVFCELMQEDNNRKDETPFEKFSREFSKGVQDGCMMWGIENKKIK